MVVNRKQPVAPVPLVQSRSTSQQHIVARKKQSKHGNGIDSHKPPSTSPDPQSKSISRPRPRPRKKSLQNKIFAWSLSLFVLYSFLFCSPYTTTPQKSQSHLICRVESGYKTYILDPYILPPLKHTLTFTHSLAKPYISQVNTHLEPYLAPVKQVTFTVKPYVIQVAATTQRVWEATLIPFYKNTMKPYYQLAILPRYNLYLRPYLLPLERYCAYYVSNPIRIQFKRVQLHFSTLYATHTHPYISHLQPYIRHFRSTVQTTRLTTVYFYGTYIQPILQLTWSQAHPHLFFAFDKAKDISLNAAAGSVKHFKRLANQVGTQRRTYVDPHIRKIWDKVEENATTKTMMAIPTPVDISLREETAESTIISSLRTDEVTKPITNTNPDTLPIDIPVPGEDVQGVLHPAESTPPLASSPLHSTSILEEVQSVVSIAKASAHGASAVLYEMEGEVDARNSYTVENSESKHTDMAQSEGVEARFNTEKTSNKAVASTPEHVPEAFSTESIAEVSLTSASPTPSTGAAFGGVIGVGASSSPSDSTSAGEDDLDNFLRDIGINTSSSPPPPPSATTTEPSEAEKAAASAAAQEAEASRLASIAAKRLAITTRHTKFENDLQSAILSSTSQIIDKITEMREAKKEELLHMIKGETGFVSGLIMSGDKLMKGLDNYLKKCQERSGTWKHRGVVENDVKGKGEDDEDIQKRTGIAKDEQTRFESVIEKVEIKFLDAVQKLHGQVTGWYSGMIKIEHQEIYEVASRIKNMAEEAQGNLGMDYAWLEGVTYSDWQRYHDLMRAFEKFEQTAHAIQNGTSIEPPSPPNPVIPVIDALLEELQTVILGFNVALGNVRNTIPEVFSIHESVPERDDGANAGGEEDKVRIQPIDPDVDGEHGKEKMGQNEGGFDASKVIIGKSKEQIEQALGDVPLVKHEEL